MAKPFRTSHDVKSVVVLLKVLSVLVLCEANAINLALFKPTLQSSTFNSYNSSKAVDGNRKAHFHGDSCTKTQKESLAWFLVDLTEPRHVTHVQITNRQTMGFRLSNFTVELSVESPETLPGFPEKRAGTVCMESVQPMPDGATILYHCQQEMIARYVRLVRLSLDRLSALTICEFEVYNLRQWKFQPAEKFTSKPDVMETLSGLRSVLECAKTCASKTGKACHLIQFYAPTGKCELLGSSNAHSEKKASDWQVYVLN